MSPFRSVILAGALAALAQAYTAPTNQTWGPLLTPDLSTPVTQGETFDVTWDPQSNPTDGVTVSLVLCYGPSNNCQVAPTAIVEGVPAAQKSYSWSVPCDLAAGTQSTATGYGMLIIVDGTGQFQCENSFISSVSLTYGFADSTQFSVLSSSKCGSSTTATASTISTSSTSPGGWTSVVGPGQGGYSSGAWNGSTSSVTISTSSASISAPTSIVYATSSAVPGTLSTSVAAGTTSYAVASPSAPAATASTFPGAGVKVQSIGLFGLIAGAIAMLAL